MHSDFFCIPATRRPKLDPDQMRCRWAVHLYLDLPRGEADVVALPIGMAMSRLHRGKYQSEEKMFVQILLPLARERLATIADDAPLIQAARASQDRH